VEVKFQNPPSMEEVRKSLSSQSLPSFELQSVSGHGIFIIRTQLVNTTPSDSTLNVGEETQDVGKKITLILQESFPDRPFEMLRQEFVGPSVGKHLGKQTLTAFLLTFAGIIIFVAFRFHSGTWGVSGVLAIIHDVWATVGLLSLLDKDITVTVVAALLALAGYSINDTIVVFDFMRERLRLRRTESLAEMINKSVNDTISRTVITGVSVLLVLLTLFFFGGEVIHDFALTMLFGTIVGTYSSIAIASPIIYEWELIRTKKK
jgi:preprotein translocase SecF subunit